tara:strand:+ start:838 stop:1722 length:885 start_codon:yes stop_codon:yes gene_type:complete
MGHHHHGHGNQKGMVTAFWLNLTFTIIEIIGGFWVNSTAILTDAIHDMGDSIAIGTGIWLEKLAHKKRTPTYTYGYKRFSPLSAVILSVFLISGSSIMLVKSGIELFQPHQVDPFGMFWLAVLGVAINALAFYRIYKQEKEHHSVNTRAIMLHFMEDVLGWVAVLVGGAVIYFTNWYWIDPLISVGISIYILSQAIPNLINTVKIFLQAVPDTVDPKAIQDTLHNINGVTDLHDFHLWTLDGNYHILSLHLVINKSENTETIRQKALEILERKKIDHSTIQIETVGEKCPLSSC